VEKTTHFLPPSGMIASPGDRERRRARRRLSALPSPQRLTSTLAINGPEMDTSASEVLASSSHYPVPLVTPLFVQSEVNPSDFEVPPPPFKNTPTKRV